MSALSLGVLANSSKEDEFRLPIHPQHVDQIDEDLRERILLEHGYGDRFGVFDDRLARQVAGMGSRAEIIEAPDAAPRPPSTTPPASATARFCGVGHTPCRTRN